MEKEFDFCIKSAAICPPNSTSFPYVFTTYRPRVESYAGENSYG
jgi:hypothetical protein